MKAKLAALILLIAPIVHAKGDRMTTDKNSQPIWTNDARSVSYLSHTGGRVEELHFDAHVNRIVRIVTESAGSGPLKTVAQADLTAAQTQNLINFLKSLKLAEATAKNGPPPGGHSSFEVTYNTTGPRTLASEEGVSAGTRYFVLTDAQEEALFKALHSITPPVK